MVPSVKASKTIQVSLTREVRDQDVIKLKINGKVRVHTLED